MSDTSSGDATDRILAKAEREAAADRLWKAREILRGAIRTHPTEVRILEAYGVLLDCLGDRVEAGKYLFLSGRRGTDVEEAIALFISRHGKGHLSNLTRQFPSGVRTAGLDSLPPVVAADLEALGLPSSERPDASMQERMAPSNWEGSLTLIGCFVVVVVLGVSALVGFFVIIDWLFGSR